MLEEYWIWCQHSEQTGLNSSLLHFIFMFHKLYVFSLHAPRGSDADVTVCVSRTCGYVSEGRTSFCREFTLKERQFVVSSSFLMQKPCHMHCPARFSRFLWTWMMKKLVCINFSMYDLFYSKHLCSKGLQQFKKMTLFCYNNRFIVHIFLFLFLKSKISFLFKKWQTLWPIYIKTHLLSFH